MGTYWHILIIVIYLVLVIFVTEPVNSVVDLSCLFSVSVLLWWMGRV